MNAQVESTLEDQVNAALAFANAKTATEPDIEVIRDALLQANEMLAAMDLETVKLARIVEEYEEEMLALAQESAALYADAERYALLKFILPAAFQLAAQAGAEGRADSIRVLSELDVNELDGRLDRQINNGLLERFRLDFEAREAQSEQGNRQD